MKIGFIGCGKMAGAIISAIKDNVYVTGSEVNQEIANCASEKLGIDVLTDNIELVKDSDVIFIATKPNNVSDVLNEIKDCMTDDKFIVSIAAGVTTSKIENILKNVRVIRVMPNTPALVKLGMFGVCKGSKATDDDENYVINLLSEIGKCIKVKESQMDIVTAISGSGPAFFYKVINEIARAGEKLGMDYEKALLLSIQTAIGSAKMAKNREISMEQLISNVATKGGCTAVGVDRMNIYDTEKVFFDVISDTTKKACELGK